jgi:starvation-inducible DNA-binding protein
MNKESKMKQIVPRNLATPSDLRAAARQAIAKAINPLVADTFALYIKTKNFHWHVSGSHFRDYHLLLDEQAEQIFLMIDVLAERVRKLGGTTIHSVGQIKQLQRIEDDDANLKPKEMLRHLINDNENFASYLRAAHQICSEKNDVATTSLLENFIDETERRIWFLFETLSE